MATSSGTLTASGIGSGLDVNGIVTKLMQVEQQPLVALAQREARFTSQLSTLGTIKGALGSFQTAAGALKVAGSSASYKFSSSDSNSVSGSANSTSAAGTYSVTVTQLAQAQRVLGELGALHIHVHRVAVDRGLDHAAIRQFRLGRTRRDRATRGLVSRRLCHRGGECRFEVEIARLVTRRVCIRDVRCQNLLSLRAQV